MTLPYGSWPSPISAAGLARAGGTASCPSADGEDVYWLQTREESGSRVVLVRRREGQLEDVSPDSVNVASRVHEYGGGAYAVRDGVVLAVDKASQRVWRLDGLTGESRPLTPQVPDAVLRYAAMEIDVPRGVCYAIREDHRGAGEPVNEIVRIALDAAGDDEGVVVVTGADFVIDPVLSPLGDHLAWVQWSHPEMPWEAGRVMVGDLDEDGSILVQRQVAGGNEEVAGTPVWWSESTLACIVESGDFARPCLVPADGSAPPRALVEDEHEYGLPAWVLRTRSMTRVSSDTLAVVRHEDGVARVVLLGADGTVSPLDRQVLAPNSLSLCSAGVLCEGGCLDEVTSVLVLPLDGAEHTTLFRRGGEVDPAYAPQVEAVSWAGSEGETAHGFLHRPRHPEADAPTGELPPLMVIAHGGPTSATNPTLRASTAYFTSRGIAVLDVNYAGSTGYGRDYRHRLDRRWGLADIEDCVAGAQHLAATGVVDPDRLGVRGGSAGGFVVLAALAFHDVFTAGVSLFGVADLGLLARETHKFESRYLDRLIGPWPEEEETYAARSPLGHVEDISAPLLLLQGLDDLVVPPAQAEGMAQALRERGRPVALVEFPGEGHGFREPANLTRAWELETSFLAQLWGYQPADDPEQVRIEG